MDTEGYLQDIINNIAFYPVTSTALIALIASILLLILSGFMSGSEVAFFSLTPAHIEEIKSKRHAKDQLLEKLLANSEKLLGTILVGNNLVNVAIVMLSNFAVAHLVDFSAAPTAGFIFQVVLLTFLLLLFGEILPKIYCQNKPLEFSRLVSPMINVMMKIFSPLTVVLVALGNVVTRSVGKKTFALSADDLSKAIELTTDKEEEQGMLNEIVKFYTKTASEVMTQRLDIEAIEWEFDYHEILSFITEKGYSRIPVYDERIDNVKGILYVKDLLPHLKEAADFEWQKLLRSVFYVPETMKVDKLLEEFREQKIHLAIVVDEFGGTSGLVTMEDLLEEVVGEITDEYDDDSILYKVDTDGSFIFDAKISLVDFLRCTKIDPSDYLNEVMEDVDTLGGLLLEVKGDFPVVGETILVEDIKFIVLEMGRRRISQIRYIPDEPLPK